MTRNRILVLLTLFSMLFVLGSCGNENCPWYKEFLSICNGCGEIQIKLGWCIDGSRALEDNSGSGSTNQILANRASEEIFDPKPEDGCKNGEDRDNLLGFICVPFGSSLETELLKILGMVCLVAIMFIAFVAGFYFWASKDNIGP